MCRLTQVVLENRLLNGCLSTSCPEESEFNKLPIKTFDIYKIPLMAFEICDPFGVRHLHY